MLGGVTRFRYTCRARKSWDRAWFVLYGAFVSGCRILTASNKLAVMVAASSTYPSLPFLLSVPPGLVSASRYALWVDPRHGTRSSNADINLRCGCDLAPRSDYTQSRTSVEDSVSHCIYGTLGSISAKFYQSGPYAASEVNILSARCACGARLSVQEESRTRRRPTMGTKAWCFSLQHVAAAVGVSTYEFASVCRAA